MPKRLPTMNISAVIPLYNEALCLESTVGRIVSWLNARGGRWELILVNDGSTDLTAILARRMSMHDRRIRVLESAVNRGKGHAVRTGMLAAKGDFRLFMDADLAVPVTFVEGILAALAQGAQVAVGSRHLETSRLRIREGALRQFMGGVYRQMILWAFRLTVSDITCGLKGFTAEAADALFSRARIDRWGYDAELLFLARRLGFVVAEVPVEWYHSFDSAVRVGRDSLGTVLETVRIWRTFLQGKYRLP